jgi:hypothetical protein
VNCGPPNSPAKPGDQLNIDILDIMGLGKIIVPVKCDPSKNQKCPGGGDFPKNGYCPSCPPTPTPHTPTPGEDVLDVQQNNVVKMLHIFR